MLGFSSSDLCFAESVGNFRKPEKSEKNFLQKNNFSRECSTQFFELSSKIALKLIANAAKIGKFVVLNMNFRPF